MTFPYKTQPFEHQREALRRSARKRAYAWLMEQGTGKTKVGIDNTAFLFLEKEVDALVVVAPNGVHRNWLEEELPGHMSDAVKWSALVWSSGKSNTKAFQAQFKDLIKYDGLAILLMNVDAVITTHGKAAMNNFLRKRKCIMIVDESTDIKTPGAKRTKSIRAMGRWAKYRRIMTGTLVDKPLDAFSQFAFLDPNIIGVRSFTAFKHEFAVIEQRQFGADTKSVPIIVGYKNLDRLHKRIFNSAYRVRKDDVLDLPPKLYSKRHFDLAPNQLRMYKELVTRFRTEVNNRTVTTPNVLSRMLRLQQITSGYVGIAADEPVEIIPGPNPRLETLKKIIEENENKMIIWARFTLDIELIMSILGEEAVRYDGSVHEDDRVKAIKNFQQGDAKYFVAHPAAAGRGLTLHAAHTVVYYTNLFGLEPRLQSEDRAHRAGLTHPVLYIDIIGNMTVDERIVNTLRAKKELADVIQGDPTKDWL